MYETTFTLRLCADLEKKSTHAIPYLQIFKDDYEIISKIDV
jgi:hypothetical protein